MERSVCAFFFWNADDFRRRCFLSRWIWTRFVMRKHSKFIIQWKCVFSPLSCTIHFNYIIVLGCFALPPNHRAFQPVNERCFEKCIFYVKWSNYFYQNKCFNNWTQCVRLSREVALKHFSKKLYPFFNVPMKHKDKKNVLTVISYACIKDNVINIY